MGAPAIRSFDTEAIKASLKSCVLFADADDQVLQAAAEFCEPISFRKGEHIILENEANDSVFFVYHGLVEIVRYIESAKQLQRLALIKEGGHFAEFSVLTRSSRSGSAYACEDSDLFRMSGTNFIALLHKFPNIARNLVARLANMANQSIDVNDIVAFYQNEEFQVTSTLKDILPIPYWKKFGVIPFGFTAGQFTVLSTSPSINDLIHFIESAYPSLTISVILVSKSKFEELYLRASELFKMLGNKKVEVKEPAPAPMDTIQVLKQSPLFAIFNEATLQQMLPHLEVTEVKAGTQIIIPNRAPEKIYLLARGKAMVSRQLYNTKATTPLMKVIPGELFGESHLMAGTKTSSEVRAISDVTVISFKKPLLDHLMMHQPFVVVMAQWLAKKLQSLGAATGLRYDDGKGVQTFSSVINLLPLDLIREEKILPMVLRNNEITIGTVNADTSTVLIRVGRYLTDYRIRLVGITNETFQSLLKAFELEYEAIKPVSERQGKQNEANVDVVKLIEEILQNAVNSRASDIHFEPGPHGMTVRTRVDGVLRELGSKIKGNVSSGLINRLKILSSMDISQQHAPQDGHLECHVGSQKIVARSNSLPIKHGEKIVLRIVRERDSIIPLDMLAPDQRVIKTLQRVARAQQGLFLVTGPTGSGKTTTLYSLLHAINQIGVNVISLEDPIETEILGINQVEMHPKRGLDFTTALRAVLRQDPDVLMVGEIRDELSAKIVFESAVTGHLVLSTLHSGSSFDAVHRLKELGISLTNQAEGLVGVLTQRLVRRICKHCVSERPITESEKQILLEVFPTAQMPEFLKFGRGCTDCAHTGYRDQIPVFEIWETSAQLREAIRQDKGVMELQEIARASGFETLYEFGLRLVLSGQTTVEEVQRILVPNR